MYGLGQLSPAAQAIMQSDMFAQEAQYRTFEAALAHKEAQQRRMLFGVGAGAAGLLAGVLAVKFLF